MIWALAGVSVVILVTGIGVVLTVGGFASDIVGGAEDVLGGGGADGTDPAATASPGANPTDPVPTPVVTNGRAIGQGVIVPVPEGWSVDSANLPYGQVIVRSGDLVDTQRLVAADDVLTSPQSSLEGDSLGDLIRQVRRAKDAEAVIDEPLDFRGAEQAHQLVFEDVAGRGPGTPGEGPPYKELIILARSPDGQYALFYYRALSDAWDPQLAQRLRNQGGLDPDSEPSRRGRR